MPFVSERHRDLPEVVVIRPPTFTDARGWFSESYKRSVFAANGIDAEFVQVNRSRSSERGTLRGLHYQVEPFAQGKLIQCAVGSFFDVAVDVRRGSPTFARWAGVEISASEGTMVWVPAGFAHGALALEDGAELLYLTTAEYSPQHDRSILWSDPTLSIPWPTAAPLLSTKDAAAPLLADCDNTFVWSRPG